MKFVQIKCNGEMDDCDEKITTRNIKSIFKKISMCKQINHLYTWSYDDLSIVCYGNIEGCSGKENKHDLPPNGDIILKTIDNSDTQLLFNDIFIIAKNDNTIVDFDTSDYSLFYSICFDEFDDCYSDEEELDESESEQGNDSMDDFIVNGTECNDEDDEDDEGVEDDKEDIIEDNEFNDSDEDLDEDMTQY